MLDPQQIRDTVKKLEPWWHCIDLGQGITTKSSSLIGEPIDHPRDRWKAIGDALPRDLTGKSVLDIGCNAGFFSVEAKRRNAARVLGVDAQRREIRQAMFVARVLGLDIELRQMSIYDLRPATIGTFDVTLALGLLYHCKHLMMAVETLFAVTDELLIVDSSVLPAKAIRKTVRFDAGRVHEHIQMLGYAEQRPQNENHANWFFPTGECLKAMLLDVGFSQVDVALNEGQRAVLVCHKDLDHFDSRTPRGLSSRIRVVDGPAVCTPGEELSFLVRVENTGFAKWLSVSNEPDNRGAVWLGAHLATEAFDVDRNYGGGALEHDVRPQQGAVVSLKLRAPSQPGRYQIDFDMVSEHVTWFQDVGSHACVHDLEVR